MSYLDNENESLKREIASLKGDLYQTQRELVSLGALIAETAAWAKSNPSSHDRNFETVMIYPALDYIERNANNAVRRGGGSFMSAEHVKGETTPTEDLVKWLGWNKETPTSIKLDTDGTYPVEKVVELLESINAKLEHIDFRTSMK